MYSSRETGIDNSFYKNDITSKTITSSLFHNYTLDIFKTKISKEYEEQITTILLPQIIDGQLSSIFITKTATEDVKTTTVKVNSNFSNNLFLKFRDSLTEFAKYTYEKVFFMECALLVSNKFRLELAVNQRCQFICHGLQYIGYNNNNKMHIIKENMRIIISHLLEVNDTNMDNNDLEFDSFTFSDDDNNDELEEGSQSQTQPLDDLDDDVYLNTLLDILCHLYSLVIMKILKHINSTIIEKTHVEFNINYKSKKSNNNNNRNKNTTKIQSKSTKLTNKSNVSNNTNNNNERKSNVVIIDSDATTTISNKNKKKKSTISSPALTRSKSQTRRDLSS